MASFLKKEKQYGLIIPTRKGAAKPVARPSAFGDSSSDEVSKHIEGRRQTCWLAVMQEIDGKKHVNVALRRENEKRQKQVSSATMYTCLVVHHSSTLILLPSRPTKQLLRHWQRIPPYLSMTVSMIR